MIATILPLLPTPYPLHAKHGALIQKFLRRNNRRRSHLVGTKFAGSRILAEITEIMAEAFFCEFGGGLSDILA